MHPRNPSLGPTSRPAPARAPAPPLSPTTPAARRPDTPRRTAQETPRACVDGSSRNGARSQYRDSRHNQIHHASEAIPRTKGILEPDSDKLKIPRFSGGTYSKPDARVKMIPAEDITYLQRRKSYGRTVGSAGLQKRHRRRSLTPPPNSRKVSLVGSTSVTPIPMTSASSFDSCLSRKRLETTENRQPFSRGHISSSAIPKITSLENPASPRCRSSQPQSSKKLSVSLPKGAMINPVSPSPKQMRAPHLSEDSVCTEAGPSKSLCKQQGGKLCITDINSTTSATTPGLQAPTVEPALLSPTSVLSGRPAEVYPDTGTAAPVAQEIIVTPVSMSPIPVHNESSKECNNIPSMHNPQSTASAQHGALLKERNSGISINCSRSSGAQIILHSKPHKKHNQPEDHWKGIFHVTGELIHTLDGLEVHFPFQTDVKAYEASKHMPENLNLEALPLSQLWPKKFKMEPPDSQDIGLWFVSSQKRPHRSFSHLIAKVASHTGLWTKVGDSELAIFSSNLLSSHDQRKNGELYFWGVFGKRIRKKRCQPNSHIKNVKINNPLTKRKEIKNTESDFGMTWGARGNPTDGTGNKERVRDNCEGIANVSELTGDKETDRVDGCMAVLGTPDSNPASSSSAPAASLLNGCCSHDSANKSTCSLEDSKCQPADRSSASSDLMLDIPPGFSLDVTPGFSEAHHQLQNEPAAVSCAETPPSLILDTAPPGFSLDVPPGFSEAHRKLQNEPAAVSCAETPPSLILDTPPPGFSLDVPPGFSEAHRKLQNEPAAMSCAETSPSLILDTPPPGFSLDVPPGFSEAHRQFQNEPAAVSCVETPPSLILDTPPGFHMGIPPGFTEAHGRLPAAISTAGPETCVSTPGTEKNPPVRFSLNVPRPVKMEEVPPGFTTLHAVKKEPGLPTVDNATEKQHSLVSAASSMEKAGKADEMEITGNEVKAEQNENSEEREFPKIKRLSDLYPRPSDTDSTGFSQPVHLPEKFQERAPEKHMHPRKRGRQESPEHSPADTTTRRLSVNGRIALKNSSGQGDVINAALDISCKAVPNVNH
ncbi:hypothetical protein HU200_016951 [Digitaria exilis]|uniref:AIPP2-like SPOC-like domain-containing protein n=1 Tax=Digitaria exilis TaxID=1010633 RepID=A0A835F7I5_9POAL|nr:hypothetical protein HU200_016951 [Digitaria exilis]